MALRNEKPDLTPLFEQHPDPIVVVDASERVQQWNAAARELFIDAPAPKLRDRRGMLRQFALYPISLTDGRSAVVMRDMTRVHELEAELSLLRRADSMGLRTTALVHDLNDLLTPVVCLTTLVAGRMDQKSRLGNLAKEAANTAELAGRMTRRVLAQVRDGTEDSQAVDVPELIEQVRPVLDRLVGDCGLRVELDPAAGCARVDGVLLERALINLVSNVRDALGPDGCVVISTDALEIPASEIRTYGVPAPGPYVVISITNTGSPLSGEAKERIMDGVYSDKKRAAGLGFGLVNAHRFARQAGGGLTLDEQEGAMTATLCLPQVPPSPKAELAPSSTRGHEAVLLVEADDCLAEIMQLVLEEEGYEVTTADSAENALALLSRAGFRPDLAVVSATEAGPDGRTLAELLEASGLVRAVGLLNGEELHVLQRHGVNPDDPRLLHKPFSTDQLLGSVRSWIDARARRSA